MPFIIVSQSPLSSFSSFLFAENIPPFPSIWYYMLNLFYCCKRYIEWILLNGIFVTRPEFVSSIIIIISVWYYFRSGLKNLSPKNSNWFQINVKLTRALTSFIVPKRITWNFLTSKSAEMVLFIYNSNLVTLTSFFNVTRFLAILELSIACFYIFSIKDSIIYFLPTNSSSKHS